MRQKNGFYTTSFMGIVIMILAGLMTGCEQPAKTEVPPDSPKSVSPGLGATPQVATAQKQDTNNIEPKPEATGLKSAATDKPQPKAQETAKVIEQRLMTLEDTTTFKKLHTAEIICMSRPDAKRDPNAPEPNINVDWYVRIDGQLGPRHDGIGMIAFSPDGNHIAYAAKEGSKFHLIVDGNIASPEFDNIEYITFSPDGNHLAYGAQFGDKWFAVVDGNAGPNYDFVVNFAFSPDSRRFTHAAGKQNGKKQTVVLDGVEICPPYDATGVPVFSNDSKRMAFIANEDTLKKFIKKFIVVDGKPDEIYEAVYQPVFSPDGRHYAYFAEREFYRFLVFDGNAGTPFEFLPKKDSPVFGPNDSRVAYRAQLEGNWFVIIDDNVGPFFDGIGDRSIVLSPDGKRHAYTAQIGAQWCVVVNGQPGPLYDGVVADGPVFSPDGSHFAYGALLNSRFFIVLDHQPVPGYDNYDEMGNNFISFSPDGKHLIYKVLKDKKWYMAMDGQLGPAYDKLQFKPTFTENTVEYFAQRQGWVFRCRRFLEGSGISRVESEAEAPDNQPAKTNKPQPVIEKMVTVDEQRLIPLEDANDYRRIAYISDNLMVVVSDCPRENPDNLVLVLGGPLRNTNSFYYGKGVSSFYIGKYEVTQKEWIEVMGSNPSKFKGDDLPVESATWYDCVEYCNKRSIKEGLKPYYNIDKNKKDPFNKNERDDRKWTVTLNAGANGYRLPTDAEWEYAAGGGLNSRGYIYSGSDNIDEVAWYWRNSGDKYQTGFWHRLSIEGNNNRTKPVGGKVSNELGLYDMSGNVREWCWEWHGNIGLNGPERVWRGGGWIGIDFPCELSYRGSFEPNDKSPDQGLRLCRSR